MGFYDHTKEERNKLVEKINRNILSDIIENKVGFIIEYFSDEDTYIRKAAYQAIGKIYFANKELQNKIISLFEKLLREKDPKIRQSTINASGEIAIREFETVEPLFDLGLYDEHHSVKNAVIGSLKKAGEKNPEPVFIFARKYLHHPDEEVRREICHGIELRGRKHPHEVLPLLKELQHEQKARVRNMVIHVLGQIAYEAGCLEKVVADLNHWENKEIVEEALEEIIEVHGRYKNFAAFTQRQAADYIGKHYLKKH
jgi:3-methyladenine DNA glycosylase AlkC